MKRLLIVQDVPTQFDMPLYNYLAEHADFELTVIYTQVQQSGVSSIDPEIGRAPQWDHIEREVYDRIDLDQQLVGRPVEVVDLISSKAPDLVVLSGYYPPLHRKLAGHLKKRGFRIGLRSDNTLQHSNFRGIKGLAKQIVLPVWLRRYDSWHPVGTLAARYLETMSRSCRPSHLFSYNVDNEWFLLQSTKHSQQRQKLLGEIGFSDGDFIVLGIMKWHEREDPLTLINAFSALSKHCANARLILAGDGPLRDIVEERLADLPGNVHMPGYLPYTQLPKYYALADVFVHPAPDEPWGVSVNEAMACGVPVVASNAVGAAVDLVDEGVTGHTFAAGDWQALAAKLTEMSDIDVASMRNACIGKMQHWSYSQTMAAFHQALAESS